MIAFLRRWGWLILFGLGAAAVYVLTAGRVKLNVAAEVAAAKADADAVKILAEADHATAVRRIEAQHQETLDKLNGAQLLEADALRQDPRKLARWLARVGAST